MMLIKNYALFVLVQGKNIYHSVRGHKASPILCDEDRKCEPLKLFKRFPPCYLGLGAELDLFQHTHTKEGAELQGSDLWVVVEGNVWSQTEEVMTFLEIKYSNTRYKDSHTYNHFPYHPCLVRTFHPQCVLLPGMPSTRCSSPIKSLLKGFLSFSS